MIVLKDLNIDGNITQLADQDPVGTVRDLRHRVDFSRSFTGRGLRVAQGGVVGRESVIQRRPSSALLVASVLNRGITA